MFTHLNVHSLFSRMSGVNSPRDLVRQAQKVRQRHLALTEVNGLFGFIKFVQAAREHHILPIAGSNIFNGKNEAVILAETQKGYENLCQIVSAVHQEPEPDLVKIIAPYADDLFVLSPNPNTLSTLATVIQKSHLFVELRPGIQEATAHRLAKANGLEIVVSGDVYFIHPDDAKAHKLLRAIDKNTTLSHLQPDEYKDEQHYFQTEKELIALFPNSLEAINNAEYLAERCKTDWNFINTIFPEMSLKNTYHANRELKKLVYKGARQRYPEMAKVVRKRIEYELSVISQKGFAPYFLIVADIVEQTKSTIGRGSGAASIVSYCLFITQVDPIKYNLQFERFIHEERVDMPDIDVDFPWDERDDALTYVFKKYGLQRTAMVSSQVFMQPRSAIRETGKVFGLSNEEIHTINKRIGYSRSQKELTKWITGDARFKDADLNETLLDIISQSEKILGAFKMSSVHPGGMVIVPDDIRRYVPVLTAPKGVQIIEWDKDQAEDAGLVKIDLLGNRSLAVVRDTLRQVGLQRNRYMDYHSIQPTTDPETESLLKSGKTMGVFYIESPATRLLLKKAGKVDFEHIVIYSSIIRPAANRFINIMLERIHGKPWKLPHPDLKCLAESYGIMVYEEQVSMVAKQLAGFSYARADYLRKVISKPSLAPVLPKWKKKFIEGAVKRGYTHSLAANLWNMMQSFSGYSFCKPHSASYAMLSFTCAYLKAHYPAEFLAAVVTNQGGYYSTYAYLSEARRRDIRILFPDINCSHSGFSGSGQEIRMGFQVINALQRTAIAKVLEARKAGLFSSMEDFFLRVEIDLSDAMALTKAFCFAGIAPRLSYRQIALYVVWFYKNPKKQPAKTPQSVLPSEPLTKSEQVQLEIESFGFPVSAHPLETYLPLLNNKIKKAINLSQYENQSIYLAGVYITRKMAKTKSGDAMEFITFEDETDIYECVMFPEAFKKYADLLNWETLFLIQGTVENAFNTHTLTIERLFSLPNVLKRIKKGINNSTENFQKSLKTQS